MHNAERPFRSVLVALDAGPRSERVLDRAALLPLAADAGVTMLHVIPKLRTRMTRRCIERNARTVLHACAKRVTRKLPRAGSISSIVTAGFAGSEIVEHARAVGAEILVMGSGPMTSRVIRHVDRPVLVVRRAVREYRRPLLALDLDDTAARVLPRVLATPRPAVALVHANEAPLHAWLSREESAARRLAAMITRLPAEIRWKRHVRRGASRTVIAETATKLDCDLLVMGTHARSRLAHACLGSVALDVMRQVSCDVLVVPSP